MRPLFSIIDNGSKQWTFRRGSYLPQRFTPRKPKHRERPKMRKCLDLYVPKITAMDNIHNG